MYHDVREGTHGWTTAAWVAHDAPRAEALTARHLALIQALEAKGVQRLYTSYTYSPGSELLNFYARERIVVSEAMGERYTPYFDALEREPEPAFLYPGGADSLTPTLTVLGASAEREQIGSYDLIRRVRGRNHRYRQIPATGFRASASHEAPATGHVWDRDMDTFWTSGQRTQTQRAATAADQWGARMNRCEDRRGVTATRIRTGRRRHEVLEELAAAGASCHSQYAAPVSTRSAPKSI